MANTTVPAELVAVNAIQGTLIADNAITAVHIATNAVSGTLVADNGITAVHIATNAVTPLQIQADAVTGAKIADDVIDSEHYADGSIDTAHIANSQVTSAKLADNSVTSAKIVNGTIVAADLADDAVTIAKMAALARGKLIVGDSSGAPTALALGSANQLLTSDGTDVTWSALNSGIDDNSNAVAMTIDSSERVLIGHTAVVPIRTINQRVQISGTDQPTSGLSLARYQNGAYAPGIHFAKSRNATVGSHTIVQDGDRLGDITFYGSDGTDFASHSAAIMAHIDGTPGENDTPGRLTFHTTADGAGSATERMRINSAGNVGIGTSSPGATLHINTSTNSPMLVESTHGDGGYIELQLSDSGGAGSLTGYIGDSEALVTSGTAADLAIRAQANFVVSTSGATERMRIGSNGETTFKTDADSLFKIGDGGTNAITLYGGSGDEVYIGANNAYKLRFKTDGNIVMDNGGNFGVGITSPATKLYVYNVGGGSSDCMTVQSGSTANSNVGMILFRDNDQDYCGQITTNGSTNTAIYNANTSDLRLKENITDWNVDALSLFKNIEPKEFNFKSQDEGAPKVKGYIAQTEVSKFPEAFTTDSSEEAYYSYNPGGMVIYLMKALKEQVAINEALEARVKTLEDA